jgi:hypothetical protein
MGILDLINKKKNEFQQERIKNQTVRVSRDLRTRKREAALMHLKKEESKQKEFINSVKYAKRDKAISAIRGFAKGVSQRNKARSARRVVNFGRQQGGGFGTSSNNIFGSGGETNPLYHGTNKQASNIYHTLGNAPTTRSKPKKRKVVYYE